MYALGLCDQINGRTGTPAQVRVEVGIQGLVEVDLLAARNGAAARVGWAESGPTVPSGSRNRARYLAPRCSTQP